MITPLRHTPLLPGTLQNLFYPPRENEFVYFKRAAEAPFQKSNQAGKAAWAADAAMLAYARYGARSMTAAELDDNLRRAGLTGEKIGGTPADWNAPGTQAIFATCDDFALCTFRGTERDDPADITSDADVLLVHEPDYRPVAQDSGPPLGHLSFVSHLFTTPTLVHRGFQHALNQVWDKVHTLVTTYRRQHPHAEICFTGHSL